MRIQLYNLDRCGFYKRGIQERQFGHIAEWYPAFLRWLEPKREPGVPLSDTSTTGERDGVPVDVYCLGAVGDGRGNFGVTLFSRSLNEEEGGAVVSPEASLSNPLFEDNERREGAVPGWLSYFWVIPEEEIVVALMPEGAKASVDTFRIYFREYLRQESDYLHQKYMRTDPKTGKEKPVYEYKDPSGRRAEGVFPSLKLSQEIAKAGRIEEIKRNWRDIRGFIMHTETLYLEYDRVNSTGSWVTRFIKSALFSERPQLNAEPMPADMQLQVKWRPQSREEVEEVIDEWMSETAQANSWAGVLFKNDGRQHRFEVAKSRDLMRIGDGRVPPYRWNEEHLKIGWEIVQDRVQQLLEDAKQSRASNDEDAG